MYRGSEGIFSPLAAVALLGLMSACQKGGVPDPAPVGLNSAPLAVGTSTDFAVSGTVFALRVNESQQFASNLNATIEGGKNADADTSDKVIFLYFTQNQTPINLALAGSDPGNMLFRSNVLAFTVNEAAEGGAVLDGDGASSDEDVLHLYNLSTGAKINTAQAIVKSTLTGDDKVLAFKLPSGNLGWLRINTPAVVRDSGSAMIANAVPGRDYIVGNDFIVFLDSSGIPKAIDTISVSSPFSLGGGLAAKQGSLYLHEQKAIYLQAEGSSARNGDSETSDFFPTVTNLLSESLGISATTSLSIEAESTSWRVSEDKAGFLRKESESGVVGTGNDHNGDGDKLDSVLFWLDIDDPAAYTNALLAGQELQLFSPWIAVSVPELDQNGATGSGFSGDLNGDGDTGQDRVVFLVNTSFATTENLGIDAEGLSMSSRVLCFGANESLQGEDLNGDGLVNSGAVVSQGVDLDIRTVKNLRWQADTIYTVGRKAFFRVPEGQFGFGDLNGDGDQADSCVAFWDATDAAGTTTAGTTLKAGFFGIASDETLFLFTSEESDAGKDLNGDLDKVDRVIRFLKF